MKPIQKGLAVIAGATLITVLAISFLGNSSKNGEQKDVVEVDAKSAQGEVADLGGAKALETGSGTVQGQGEAPATAGATDTNSASNAAAISAEAESAKDEQSAPQNEVVSTSDAPAPPGPFHKNTVTAIPEMPVAPTAPTSENVDLPPPPMPQGLVDAPMSPVAPEANISRPEFVAKPEMNIIAPKQPTAIVTSGEASAVHTEDAPVETNVTTDPVAETAPSTKSPVSKQIAPVAMPERPDAPMVPAEIEQSGVNVQGQPIQQPRVIFVPVPVYPYQQPNMNQQWGIQAPQMNFMPPQPPVMGESAPAQGQ